jgi:hypothetical protein
MASFQCTDVQDRPTEFLDMTSLTLDEGSVTTRLLCNSVERPSVLQTRGEGQGAGAARPACEASKARRCTLWRRLGRAGAVAPRVRRVELWGHHLVGGVCVTRMSPCLLSHRGDATPHNAHPRHGQEAGWCADGAVACPPPLGDASEQRLYTGKLATSSQVGRWAAAGVRETAACPLARGCHPHAIHVQQGFGVVGQGITGKEGDMAIGR